ncbi:MAG TPA: hypothetical protein VN688_18225 [Gemmataceae bacterium]|nr:hypothetical protein [Gemmataceae bacterium]
MTKRNTWSVAALVVPLLFVGVGLAEDPWQAVSSIPPSPDTERAATLGCPRSLSTGTPAHESSASRSSEFLGQGVAPVSFNEPSQQSVLPPPPDPPPTLHTANQPPDAAPPPTSGPMPAPPPPGDVPVNQGIIIDKPLQHSFWDKCKGYFTQGGERASASGHCLFQSDHCFDYFASPVTNPFLFEDPRALTEIKPLFIYQGAPRGNPIFHGGNAEYYGLQARLAVTERLSLTINELGFLTLNPFNSAAGPPGQFSQSTGFSEITLGPKYTFLRSEEWKTVMAGGVLFQIPAGSPKVFQNTGTLGVVPYLSAAKNFGLPAGWGSVNLMGNTGYSFSVDRQRSEYFYLNAHIDYNIANTNKFFPFLEFNYFHYTQGGQANNPGFGFEGLDLVNFGSHNVGGRDFLAISPGLRFKLNEHIQAGAAVSFPLLKQKELNDYRLTFDIIFRY